MTSHVRHRRATQAGQALPNLPMEPAELALNLADLTLFTSLSGPPVPLMPVRYWAASAQYAVGDMAVHAGALMTAKAAIAPKAFDPNDWTFNATTDDIATRVAKAGDVMTGLLTLSGAPVDVLHAATKAYVDARAWQEAPNDGKAYGRKSLSWTEVLTDAYTRAQADAKFIDAAGDSMTGALILASDPSAATHAANKSYVDARAFPEAPNDGKQYARKSLAWAEVQLPTGLGTMAYNNFVSSETAPVGPKEGDRWVKPSTGEERVWSMGAWLIPVVSGLQGYLPLTGGTLSGNLSITKLSSDVACAVDSAAGVYRSFAMKTAGKTRWALSAANEAESTNNLGSDFRLDRYSDAGNWLATALLIRRDSGAVVIQSDLNIAGYSTPAIFLNKNSAAGANQIVAQLNGVIQWAVQAGDGSNAFSVNRYTGGGAYAGTPFYAMSSGEVRIDGTLFKFMGMGTTAAGGNLYRDPGTGQVLHSTSSLRYKTNIENIEPEYSALIYQMRPVWYRSTSEADPPDWSYYGLIAEEVHQIDQRFVSYVKNEAGELIPDGIYYDRLVVPLLAEVQRLREDIDVLKAA